VEKAGGMVTDFEGRPWSPFSKSIVATNGLLHNQLLEVVNS
jgi:myo-inositol-1(or 4)-monophosphatase